MWKNVFRQFKDHARHDCPLRKNFIGCREGRAGGTSAVDDNRKSDQPKNWAAIQAARILDNDLQQESKFTSQEDFREKIRQEIRFPNGLLGALTWSSALLAGWYATKLMCYHRRRLGWTSQCSYSSALLSSSRQIHTNILSCVALAAPQPPAQVYRYEEYFPPPSSDSSQSKANATANNFGINFNELKKQLIEINNDTGANYKNKNQEDVSVETAKPTVESAVQNLVSVLGDIEFQMGIQNIAVGQYKTAVSHLKLATSHHHASATYNLGLCYEQGLGVEKDMKMAMECYMAASSVGHPKAMYNLGVFYANGLGGLKRNRREARKCFIDSAKLGQVEAKRALGLPLTEQERSTSSEPDLKQNQLRNLKLSVA